MTEWLNNNQLLHLPRNADSQKGAHLVFVLLSVYLGKYPVDKLISGHWGIWWEVTISVKSEFYTNSNNEGRKWYPWIFIHILRARYISVYPLNQPNKHTRVTSLLPVLCAWGEMRPVIHLWGLQSLLRNTPTSCLHNPQTIWGARKFPQAALMKLMIRYTWDGFLRESLEFPKGSQATCSVWCGSRDGYGANAREIALISIWFGAHRSILRSWGDIRVLLILWKCCWGLCRVQSSKSRLLMCFLGKRNCSACNAGESGLTSWRGGSLMGFLELRQAPGVYSRVTMGMPILNGSLFSEVRTPV